MGIEVHMQHIQVHHQCACSASLAITASSIHTKLYLLILSTSYNI